MSDRLKELFEKFGSPSMVSVGRNKSKGGTGMYSIFWPSHEDYPICQINGLLSDQKITRKFVRDGNKTSKHQYTTEEEQKFMPSWDDYDDLVLWMRHLESLKESWNRHSTPEERSDAEKESNELKKELEDLGYKPY